jgi:hypothetical protein
MENFRNGSIGRVATRRLEAFTYLRLRLGTGGGEQKAPTLLFGSTAQ